MYTNSAYLNNSLIDFKDKSRPLIVGSCGTYHLFTRPVLPTYRPKGRVDYQLLYIAAGKAHFFFKKGEETIVTAGHMVLYRPKEFQKYVYYGHENTEVFWIHFTGWEAKLILRRLGFPEKDHVINTGIQKRYKDIFQTIIQEMQLHKLHYEEYISLLLTELLILVNRHTVKKVKINSFVQNEIESALSYFNTNYNKDINIDAYAASKNMSTSWFIQNFKKYSGSTPMQYILSLRIFNARNLLETTSYNITEIANIIGYEDPLYFSRLFKKQVGLSPSEYRKRILPDE